MPAGPPPAPVPRPFEPVVFWIAVVTGSLAGLFGAAGIYDASHSSPSGEWSGLGVLAAFVVDVPVCLVLLGVAFTQRVRTRRVRLVVFGLVLVAMPFLAAFGLQQHRLKQRREIDERLKQHTRELLDEQKKNNDPGPPKQ